ncbi:MAG: molybdenum cofactor guanylyltransferase [Prolixibacteraceae bacterium]|jgi:molybdenum cofactor guanylyltransferase|nr:molybdenum cofactor guanylyltransferase [Prolixibacteraceae bacterium]MBT6005786.1 molybdenum cofactor guanylyltransferase [Prolixibacteraceae bacterium]MBT6766844.1 molybdenum cofactor guanylyltransferase [Prolixibacteraceae bacterium]MBT6998281.1 molybdenum cofactor guanylyltransferase [Prolixibacteraceae bacterium]MBT7396473.1 molybdenum cofactor guanylyltransferase [Prolixibacteraceae bacterium]
MKISGIILAGGKSLRMGTDKTFLEINGQTLLERAIELCRPFCQTILISSNNKEHGKLGFEIIPDEINDCGPLGGIYSCLKNSETDWNFVISVDSVFAESEFVKFLASQTGSFDAIVPVYLKGKEPLIALYHKRSLTEISKMLDSGNFKMHDLLNKLNTKFVDTQNWLEKYPQLFRNLNRPEDL